MRPHPMFMGLVAAAIVRADPDALNGAESPDLVRWCKPPVTLGSAASDAG